MYLTDADAQKFAHSVPRPEMIHPYIAQNVQVHVTSAEQCRSRNHKLESRSIDERE